VQIVGTFTQSICGTTYKMIISKDPQQKYLFVADAHNDVVWTVERQSGKTLGYFGGSGRLAGQMTFPNAIGIDTFGNIYVGEVDFGKRIQRFAPVLTGAR
jgi:sugar lactone lactonase YvrE